MWMNSQFLAGRTLLMLRSFFICFFSCFSPFHRMVGWYAWYNGNFFQVMDRLKFTFSINFSLEFLVIGQQFIRNKLIWVGTCVEVYWAKMLKFERNYNFAKVEFHSTCPTLENFVNCTLYWIHLIAQI